MRSLYFFLAGFSLIIVATSTSAASQDPEAKGKDIFREFCLHCHGPDGKGGGMGPSIIGDKSRLLSNPDIAETIRLGRLEMGMPAFGDVISSTDIANLTAHVRSLQGIEFKPEEDNGSSSAASMSLSASQQEQIFRGRTLFEGRAKCFECHSIYGDGGMEGPDLTRIAERMNQEQILEAITTPSLKIAPGYEASEIVTPDGRTIIGWSRRATPTTIEIFDPQEMLWTAYFIRDLKSERSIAESLMPSDLLEPLTKNEISDLMTFLISLDCHQCANVGLRETVINWLTLKASGNVIG